MTAKRTERRETSRHSRARARSRFVDRSHDSFTHYEGTWRVTPTDAGTTATYELTASSAFDVPGFILKRLLKRDAAQMMNRLRQEIAARAAR